MTHPLSEAGTSVEVKPLEWSAWSDGGEDAIFSCWATNCDPFTYAIVQYDEAADFSLSGIGRYASLDKAKAAAQADYRSRILSALIQSTPAETEGADPVSVTKLLSLIGDIREAAGVGAKPMLSELPDAIRSLSRHLEEAREALDLAANKFGFIAGLSDPTNILAFALGAKQFCLDAKETVSHG